MYTYLMPLSVSSLRNCASLLLGGAAYGTNVPGGGFGNPKPFIAAVHTKHMQDINQYSIRHQSESCFVM
jgi:hypothetical protein